MVGCYACAAIRRLKQFGFLIVVFTNAFVLLDVNSLRKRDRRLLSVESPFRDTLVTVIPKKYVTVVKVGCQAAERWSKFLLNRPKKSPEKGSSPWQRIVPAIETARGNDYSKH
jgi:hypothetical protein